MSISRRHLRSLRDGIVGVIMIAPFVLLLFGIHHFGEMHETIDSAHVAYPFYISTIKSITIPRFAYSHLHENALASDTKAHSNFLDKQTEKADFKGASNRADLEEFIANLLDADKNDVQGETTKKYDLGTMVPSPTLRKPNILILDSWGASSSSSMKKKSAGTPTRYDSIFQTARKRENGGAIIEDAFVALGWKSISSQIKPLSSSFVKSVWEIMHVSGASKTDSSVELLSPNDILDKIDHNQYPTSTVYEVFFGNKSKESWVLYDPAAAFVLHVWHFLFSKQSADYIVIYLEDSTFQPKMARLEWDPIVFASIWIHRTWSTWQYDRIAGQKLKITFEELETMKYALLSSKSNSGSGERYFSLNGISSHSQSSYIGRDSYMSSLNHYRTAREPTNTTINHKGKDITILLRGAISSSSFQKLKDIPCPESNAFQLLGIDSSKSEGKECALSCVNPNCTNILDACAYSSECTHIAFADLHYGSLTKLWGGSWVPFASSLFSSNKSRPYFRTSNISRTLSLKFSHNKEDGFRLASLPSNKYDSVKSGMEGALARLKHVQSLHESLAVEKSTYTERTTKLSRCIREGSDPAYDIISNMVKRHPHSVEALVEEEKIRIAQRIRKRQAPILFVHIRKAGGTTFCNLAKANNLIVPAAYTPIRYNGIAGKNCNPSPLHLSAAWSGGVNDQKIYVKALALDFYAHEKFLPRELPFGDVAFVTILRHPFDRLLSEGKHTGFKCLPTLQRKEMSFLDSHRTSIASQFSTESNAFTYYSKRVHSFHEYIECGEINPMVRRFCGCLGTLEAKGAANSPKAIACGDKSQGAIPDPLFRATVVTRRNLECAKRRLERFSVVMVTEMMFDDAAPTLLKHILGWNVLNVAGMRGGTSRQSNALEEFKHEPDTIRKLYKYHQLDLELYEHAKSLMCRALAKVKKQKSEMVT